jgi:glycosyl hydrolase family 15
LHSGVRIARVVLLCAAVVAVGIVLVSGGEDGGPKTPEALPGLPPPFLGTAVAGDGGLTAAVDAYGDVVDLRSGPAGEALIDNPADRQAAGTVAEDTGIVPRVRIGTGDDADPMAMWEADRVTQRYLGGTNVVRTVATFGLGDDAVRVVMTVAAREESLAVEMRTSGGGAGASRSGAVPSIGVFLRDGVRCARERRAALLDLICKLGRGVPPVSRSAVGRLQAKAMEEGRQWLFRSNGLGAGAPNWARSMYIRSLLTVHALTSGRTGAVAAGAREGWAYVWPRDAATAALALAASGHRTEGQKVARFLIGLDLRAAARFDEDGAPLPGRAAQGDALGWVAAAERSTKGPELIEPFAWRGRSDYQESSAGDYLGNALAAVSARTVEPISKPTTDAARALREFGTAKGLVREAGDPGSGLDSAAGWAVRPFEISALYPAAERTLLRLAADGTPYGITPGEGWEGGEDPWTAPTAWSAWALAGLAAEARREGAPAERATADRHAAIELLADLRRAATPAGNLPERVGVHTGIPTSTTPLLWSSAFAVLTLRELWP